MFFYCLVTPVWWFGLWLSTSYQRQPYAYNFCSEMLFAYICPSCQLEQVGSFPLTSLTVKVFSPTCLVMVMVSFSVCLFSVISRHHMWAHIGPLCKGLQALYTEIVATHSQHNSQADVNFPFLVCLGLFFKPKKKSAVSISLKAVSMLWGNGNQ